MSFSPSSPIRVHALGAAAALLAAALAALALADAPARPQAPPWRAAGEAELRAALARVPVVALVKDVSLAAPVDMNKERLKTLAQATVKEHTPDNRDAFVKRLISTRPDLAGLPFRMGKDCITSKAQAKLLESLADRTRFAVRVAEEAAGDRRQPDVGLFWGLLEDWETRRLPKTEAMLPALQQVLMAESPPARLFLTEFSSKRTGAVASVTLARQVVFDLDAKVRQRALAALKGRPVAEYSTVLLDALRYPWAPVAERAAEALVALDLKGLTPRLVDALEGTDPADPVLVDFLGAKLPRARELVRVNHLSNCLLCHPGSFDSKDLVRGRVPIPGETPPPPGSYGGTPDDVFVRADVTYLRQDFSVMEKVRDHGTWPQLQRFDYFVRTRWLTLAEQEAWAAAQKRGVARPLSPQRRAVLYALRSLTGRDAGSSPQAWRQIVRQSGLSQAQR